MKVKYIGPCRDYSGYGEACRHDVASLVSVGAELTTVIPAYTLEISDFGELGDLASQFEGKPLGYQFIILHVTPNVYPKYLEPGKYHIGRVFWETDKLPLDFASNVQMLDEIWTGSQYNAMAIKNAGVTKPIHIIPEAIDVKIDDSINPYITENKDSYKFYSIFEWTERKNPYGLLTAYFLEFQHDENVSLTIKTYVDSFTPEKKAEIKSHIRRIKNSLGLAKYPPLYIYTNLMDRRQVYRFHKTFDCFISTHRGEGWGIPQMEALLMGKPVISTNCGGVHEYLRHGESAYLLKYRLVPVIENSRNRQWYTPDQKWAQVEVDEIRKAMRWAVENQDEAKKIAEEGRKTITQCFNFQTIGTRMMQRMKEIKTERPEL